MKDIVTLRNHLFDALNRIADATEDQLDIEINKAAAIVQVSETIIRTAEVENQFIAITKSHGSGFVPVLNTNPSLLQIVKEKTEERDNNKKELFDVDKEKNWLKNQDTDIKEYGNSIPVASIGTID